MSLDIISHYFPSISQDQQRQYALLVELYQEWNEKINVISRKDMDNLVVHHILHSLGIAKVVSFQSNAEILDVGTGGGLPGIPLAIMFPQVHFHLVDSIGKKIKVVNHLVGALGLANVRSQQIRAEMLPNKYDFVVSRAVTRIKPFVGWVSGCFKPQSGHSLPNGILYLKGGDLEEELTELKRPYQSIELSQYFSEPFFQTKKVVYVPMV